MQFVILEELESLDNLLSREQHYMDTLEPPYNVVKKAGSRLGMKASKETREKQSKAKKGKPNGSKGIKRTPEQIEKISSTLRGRKLSEAHIKALSTGLGSRPKRGPYSEEHCAAIRQGCEQREIRRKAKMAIDPDAFKQSPEWVAKRQASIKRTKEAKIAADLAKSPLQSDTPAEYIDPSTLTLRSLWDWTEEEQQEKDA